MVFVKNFDRYVCPGDSIVCEIDGFTAVATIYRDDCGDTPDQRDDGFWPSLDPLHAGYIGDADFDEAQAKAERVMQAWRNDEWFYCGVAVTVSRQGVQLTHRYDHALWGIECNYRGGDNNYLREVANDLLPDAIESAKAKLKKLCAD